MHRDRDHRLKTPGGRAALPGEPECEVHGQTGSEESLRKKLQELEAKKAKNPPRLRPGGYKPNDAEMPATHASAAKETQRVTPDQKKAVKRENDQGGEETEAWSVISIATPPESGGSAASP